MSDEITNLDLDRKKARDLYPFQKHPDGVEVVKPFILDQVRYDEGKVLSLEHYHRLGKQVDLRYGQ